ncbi:MAG: group III truncated hemoglobin [Saprospiraceae bacterium]|jgi:hemoglobin|nr:group III truncated hemoglobin [Saprospiraceae bacterium]MBK9271944.1 group III truncated hemoglobin [Saprospiraceae bacterium]RZJ98669.1 MAG: group III truncated hemoglobin [Flavobacterium sp.]
MRQIDNRSDINILVNSFYSKVRVDELLGPIFNAHISDDKWPEHLDKLTDFWETNLFGVAKFKGNPTQKHINVDKNLNYSIEQKHFGRWLQIWFETIDELYEGEYADKAKNSARKMSTGQYLAIWQQRPENKIEY